MTDDPLLKAVRDDRARADRLARKFNRIGKERSALHTVLFGLSVVLPLATAAIGSAAGWVSLVAGLAGAVIVAFAQQYRLRAHAVIKWDTSGRLHVLAGDLGQLDRDIQYAGDVISPDVRKELEGRFKLLRERRQDILKDDRERISAATPATIDEQAVKEMRVNPAADTD